MAAGHPPSAGPQPTVRDRIGTRPRNQWGVPLASCSRRRRPRPVRSVGLSVDSWMPARRAAGLRPGWSPPSRWSYPQPARGVRGARPRPPSAAPCPVGRACRPASALRRRRSSRPHARPLVVHGLGRRQPRPGLHPGAASTRLRPRVGGAQRAVHRRRPDGGEPGVPGLGRDGGRTEGVHLPATPGPCRPREPPEWRWRTWRTTTGRLRTRGAARLGGAAARRTVSRRSGPGHASASTPAVVERNGWRIAVLGFGGVVRSGLAGDPNRPGMASGDDTESMTAAVRAAGEVAAWCSSASLGGRADAATRGRRRPGPRDDRRRGQGGVFEGTIRTGCSRSAPTRAARSPGAWATSSGPRCPGGGSRSAVAEFVVTPDSEVSGCLLPVRITSCRSHPDWSGPGRA